MMKTDARGIGRRSFLAVSAAAGVAALKVPQPRSLAAETAPSNRIRVGAIGVGKRAALLLAEGPVELEVEVHPFEPHDMREQVLRVEAR